MATTPSEKAKEERRAANASDCVPRVRSRALPADSLPSSPQRAKGPSDPSERSVATTPYSRLRPSGGYRDLRSFQTSTIVYDATASFCERFVDKHSRTVDQMIQAARSGRQNIAEGSRAATTSSQTELRLVNVARASLDELLLDYEDFLRQRGVAQWAKNDPRSLAVRAVGRGLDDRNRSDPSDSARAAPYAPWLRHNDPAIVANAVICLIHQTNYLLDQQIRALEQNFISDGGYTEQLAAARLAARRKQEGGSRNPTNSTDRSDPSDLQSTRSTRPTAPICQDCGRPMVVRTARQGARAGSQFWGCSGFPECKATRPID